MKSPRLGAAKLAAFLLLVLSAWSAGLHAAPNPEAAASVSVNSLAGVNIAALASSKTQLFVGGFDQGLYIVEHDGNTRQFRDPALHHHINALAWSESEQTLWVGTARGLTRCHLAATSRCAKVGSSLPVHALLLRADGQLVAGGDSGLTFLRDAALTEFGKKQGAPFRSVWALAEDKHQTLFVGATNGLFWGPQGAFAAGRSGLARASVVDGRLPDDWVTALLVDQGRLYLGTYNAGVVGFQLAGAGLAPLAANAAVGYVNPAGLFPLGDGQLAVATMNGLHFVEGELNDASRAPTRTSDVTALLPTARAGYWVATRRGLEHLATLSDQTR